MDTPIVDLSRLSEPVTKLVQVVADGIGTLYRPVGTVLQAKADSKAKLVIAEGEIAVSELWRRAVERLAYTELERQKNLDSIVEKAYVALPEKVDGKQVSKDWSTHFFTAAQDVNDQDLQAIWGRILAGEVAEPGSTSKRTLEFLKTISKREAELIVALLSVSLKLEKGWLFLVEDAVTTKFLDKESGGVAVEQHMIDIGVLGVEPRLINASKANRWRFSYGERKHQFFGPPSPAAFSSGLLPLELQMAIRLFSSIGQELSKVITQKVHSDFITQLSSSIEGQINVRIEEDVPIESSVANGAGEVE